MNEPNALIDWLAGWGTGSWTVTFISGKPLSIISRNREILKQSFIFTGSRFNNHVRKLTFVLRQSLSRICKLT
jgi:hypothetical protein